MEEQDIAGTQSGLPEKLSKPARRALQGAGYLTLEQLTKAGEAELLKLHGMGPKALDQLRRAMADKGLNFADEKQE
ncbi:helix-hairpin-helix domain-containing protein [Paenibacillus zanthoxyli]|uniref:DNA-directed RNA polymerase subunit alpha C-terminal domain-containing protein n=1 Tax=Paenibacillus zanthoxyli TaxID=369399 RepID=UPI00046F657A|nr:DNA-directed RNA polymerase subunit alpha C-terminal domain-containing protein [Paenibacillus zanthoxyli]